MTFVRQQQPQGKRSVVVIVRDEDPQRRDLAHAAFFARVRRLYVASWRRETCGSGDKPAKCRSITTVLRRRARHGQRSHHGVAILARGERPAELRRGLPGDELDRQARYLEAQVKGLVVASVYLPNGNPQPGPKFDYKLAWFERFNAHARALLDSGKPAVLAGDLNVVPAKADIYNERLWRLDAVVQPQTRAAFRRLLEQGWIDATRHSAATRASAWTS